MILGLLGCMTLDGFFFNPTVTDAYDLQSDIIPEDALILESFPGPDGSTLYGYWAEQADPAAPVVVYYHGNSGNLDDTTVLVGGLWSLGYRVYAADYRGYGMSTGSPSHDHVIADAVAVAEHVAASAGVTTGDLVYYGQSLGAFASSHASLERPPRGLIMESGFASGELIGDQSAALDLPSGWVLTEAYDNTAAVASLNLPLMVMHGIVDDYINLDHGDAIYAAANPTKFYWKLAGSDHAELHLVDPPAWSDHVSCWVALSWGDPTCATTLEGSFEPAG